MKDQDELGFPGSNLMLYFAEAAPKYTLLRER
jgi:hypothetical protein